MIIIFLLIIAAGVGLLVWLLRRTIKPVKEVFENSMLECNAVLQKHGITTLPVNLSPNAPIPIDTRRQMDKLLDDKYESYMNRVKQEFGLPSRDMLKETFSDFENCVVLNGDFLYHLQTLQPYKMEGIIAIRDIKHIIGLWDRSFDYTKVRKIPLKDIHYYALEGDLSYTTEVSGGGVNATGAVAGSMLFGTAGAIIGAGVGTEIQSTTRTHDDRKIIFCYEKDGNVITENIHSTNVDVTLNVLRKLLPDKDHTTASFLNSKPETPKAIENQKSLPAPTEQIKQFKELLDIGAITQEEFDAKKAELLNT